MGESAAAQHMEDTDWYHHNPPPSCILRAGHGVQHFSPGFQPKVLLQALCLISLASRAAKWHQCCSWHSTIQPTLAMGLLQVMGMSSQGWPHPIPSGLRNPSLDLPFFIPPKKIIYRHRQNNCTTKKLTKQQLIQPTVYFANSCTPAPALEDICQTQNQKTNQNALQARGRIGQNSVPSPSHQSESLILLSKGTDLFQETPSFPTTEICLRYRQKSTTFLERRKLFEQDTVSFWIKLSRHAVITMA